jgi:hypothetical protein
MAYYFNKHGHHVSGAEAGHYRMSPEWIDTDNEVWSEPTHLYTHPDEPYVPKSNPRAQVTSCALTRRA